MPNTLKLAGHVFDNTGSAVAATVQRYEVGTTTTFGSSTTASGSTGKWAFTDGQNGYDVKITYGTNVRWLKGLDELQVSELAIIQSTEGGVANFYIAADQADDAGDSWRIQAGTSDTLSIANNKNATNTFVDQFTLTNHATTTSTNLAVTGSIKVGSNIIQASDGGSTITMDTNDNVIIAGDLTISGDDLKMNTNTDTYILVADGTSYNPVAVSGDVTIANTGAITIANNAVETAMINTDAVTSAKIADDAITSALIADDAITSALIADDAVVTASIADDAITSALIADDAVVTASIADDAITSALIADDAVVSASIADNAITNALMADDAIDSDEIAAGAIDTAHIADNQVTLAKMAGLARGKIIYGDASGDPAALAVGTAGYVLATDNTDIAYTNSLLAADYVIGEDAQTKIDFETNNEIHFDVDNAERVNMTSAGIVMADDTTITLGDEGQVIFSDVAPSTDHSGTGIVIKGTLATGVAAGMAVYLKADGEYDHADKDTEGHMPAVGVALEAAGADRKILIYGVYVDASLSLTRGEELYVGDDGAVTHTVPGSGDFLQRVGVALTTTSVLFMPSLDVIEHA